MTSADLLEVSGEIPDNKTYLVSIVVNAMKKAVLNVGKKSKEED